jgi:phosphate transport system substrate-binding protein
MSLPVQASSAPEQASTPAESRMTSPVADASMNDRQHIRIGGAEHVQFIVERFNARLQSQHPDWVFVNELKGTSSVAPLLTHNQVLFGAMGRQMSTHESSAYKKIVGAAPVSVRVAHTSNDTSQHLATSLAVYVNQANPVEQLSPRQVARMLSIGNPEGDLSRWGQLGLSGVWHGRIIHAYGTPEFTGFGTTLQRMQLNGLPLVPGYESYSDTNAILQRLADDPAGIAIAAIGQADARIKQVAIIDPITGKLTTGTADEVRNGTYPYGRYLYFYLRKLPGQPLDPVALEYMRLVLSPEGQAILAEQTNGYLPLTTAEAATELKLLQEAARP